MRLNSASARLLTGVALMIGCAQLAFAGAAFPCPTAVNSKYSNALAITHATVDWEHDRTGKVVSGRTRQVSITVMTKQRFINSQHRMSTPVTYWGEFPWEIVLDGKNNADSRWFCPMPLITDDGQFLILLKVGPDMGPAMRIYRQGDSRDRMEDGTVKGSLVKEIALEEIWPPSKIDATQMWTDESPEWFAGGTFDFSEDGRQIIHKTRWGNTVRITLENGIVTRD